MQNWQIYKMVGKQCIEQVKICYTTLQLYNIRGRDHKLGKIIGRSPPMRNSSDPDCTVCFCLPTYQKVHFITAAHNRRGLMLFWDGGRTKFGWDLADTSVMLFFTNSCNTDVISLQNYIQIPEPLHYISRILLCSLWFKWKLYLNLYCSPFI